MATFAEDHINHHAKYLFQGESRIDDSQRKTNGIDKFQNLSTIISIFDGFNSIRPLNMAANMFRMHQ